MSISEALVETKPISRCPGGRMAALSAGPSIGVPGSGPCLCTVCALRPEPLLQTLSSLPEHTALARWKASGSESSFLAMLLSFILDIICTSTKQAPTGNRVPFAKKAFNRSLPPLIFTTSDDCRPKCRIEYVQAFRQSWCLIVRFS